MIAAVTFVVLIVTAGIRATPGVLMVPLEAEFGWSRAVLPPTVKLTSQAFGRENTGVDRREPSAWRVDGRVRGGGHPHSRRGL